MCRSGFWFDKVVVLTLWKAFLSLSEVDLCLFLLLLRFTIPCLCLLLSFELDPLLLLFVYLTLVPLALNMSTLLYGLASVLDCNDSFMSLEAEEMPTVEPLAIDVRSSSPCLLLYFSSICFTSAVPFCYLTNF